MPTTREEIQAMIERLENSTVRFGTESERDARFRRIVAIGDAAALLRKLAIEMEQLKQNASPFGGVGFQFGAYSNG